MNHRSPITDHRSPTITHHLNTARGKLVEVGGGPLKVDALVADVVPAHVIDHDEKHVWFRSLTLVGLGFIRFFLLCGARYS